MNTTLLNEPGTLLPRIDTPIASFVVLGRPQQRGSKQAQVIYNREGQPVTKNGRVLTFAKDSNAKSKDWMQEVRSAAHAAWGNRPLLIDPIVLTVAFFFARPQSHYGTGKNAMKLKASAPIEHAQSPDLAKLIRCLEDALTGVIWRDDRQVCRYGAGTGRYWSDSHERAEVIIRIAE